MNSTFTNEDQFCKVKIQGLVILVNYTTQISPTSSVLGESIGSLLIYSEVKLTGALSLCIFYPFALSHHLHLIHLQYFIK